MKILAIEKEIESADWGNQEEILCKEAQRVYELYLSGNLREIYFTHKNIAVLILECDNIENATELLNTLPLVQKGLIAFNIMQLNPYTGFERIFIKE
jgi:hypothetical protein